MTEMSDADGIIQMGFDLARILRHTMLCVAEEGTPVNYLQIHALLGIAQHDGMTMKELATFLHVSSPSATSFVTRLEKLGWVNRKHDAVNRKLVRLHLTDAGKAVIKEKRVKRTAAFRTLLDQLSREELQQLMHIIRKIHRSTMEHPL